MRLGATIKKLTEHGTSSIWMFYIFPSCLIAFSISGLLSFSPPSGSRFPGDIGGGAIGGKQLYHLNK